MNEMDKQTLSAARTDEMAWQLGKTSLGWIAMEKHGHADALSALRLLETWWARGLTDAEGTLLRATAARLGIDLAAFDAAQAAKEKIIHDTPKPTEDLNRLAVAAFDAITAFDRALTRAGKHFCYGPDADSREALRTATFMVAYAAGEIDDFEYDPAPEWFDDTRRSPTFNPLAATPKPASAGIFFGAVPC